jgi:hypothetical protein
MLSVNGCNGEEAPMISSLAIAFSFTPVMPGYFILADTAQLRGLTR